MDNLPNSPGAYAIELYMPESRVINVGQLGNFNFPQGVYIYSGSAFGPGGLSARLGRHMCAKSKKRRWHIDYLSEITHGRACCYINAPAGFQDRKPVECRWSLALISMHGAAVPVRGFGASDCTSKCPAHLVYFPIEGMHAKGDIPILLQGVVLAVLADAIQAPLENLVSAAL